MLTSNEIVSNYNVDLPPSNNLERWLNYMQGVESPNSYIVFGWFFAISAALQRRVWKPHGNVKCYANQFNVLVGKASIGKGRVINPVKDLFKGFRIGREVWALDAEGKLINTKNGVLTANVEDDVKEAEKKAGGAAIAGGSIPEGSGKGAALVDENLFPCPADSSSLRALTNYLAHGIRSISYLETLPNGDPKKKCYLHSSAMFLLEEIVSLFKSRCETKDMVDFLVQVWDAGDYKHATFGYGVDLIERCCVSLLAGTTPDSMEELFDQRLLKAGISSRTLFIYEEERRFRKYCTEVILKPSQLEAFHTLKCHIRKLAHVYGPVEFTPEAEEFLKYWYEKDYENSRINKCDKLDPYYGRKDMHIMKLAMAVHFSDRLDRIVTLDDVRFAYELIASVEPNMHRALKIGGRNDIYNAQQKMLGFVEANGPISDRSLFLEFNTDFKTIDEIRKTLATLQEMGMIDRLANGKYTGKKSGYKGTVPTTPTPQQ